MPESAHRALKLPLAAALAAVGLMCLLFAWGCSTVPETIEEGLSPAEFFQRAQEASDNGWYAAAQKYYTVFLERYPEQTERVLWAKYEIAFLHHKMGDDELAIEGFEALLREYELGPPELPQGPRILAEKVKARLEEEAAEAQEAEPPEAETGP
ncbi:MAG: hypothetical protein JW820_15630 [Spirochaetales bacterium]|nr:hypothetical protein [Spirochaetales bacterium]